MAYEDTCIELDLDPTLTEAGGIVSWLARVYTGKDTDLPAEIEKELESIKTEEKRAKLLEEIDEFIKEAKSANAASGGVKFPPELEPGKVTFPGSELHKKRMEFLHKEGYSFWRNFKKALTGLVPALVLTAITARDGTITKYIAELQSVRAKVAAKKLPPASA